MERKAKGTQQGGKGRTQQTKARGVFFQKQKMGTRCRMHALNNALGRAAIGVEGFNAACDAFDARYGLSGSRLYFLLADVSPQPPPLAPEPTESPKNESDEAENEDGGSENEGGLEKETREEGSQKTDDEEEDGEEKEEEEEVGDHNEEGMVDDVLSYILRERFRYRTKYIPMGGTVNRLHREELNQCEAFLSFSAGHVWANRRVGHTWYCLDSLQGRPTPIKPNKALAAGLGHILIYAKSDQGGPKQTSAAETESNRSAKKTKKRAKEDRGKRAPGEEEHRKGADVVQPVDRVETRDDDDDDDDDEESEEGEQEAQLLAPTTNPFDCLGDE